MLASETGWVDRRIRKASSFKQASFSAPSKYSVGDPAAAVGGSPRGGSLSYLEREGTMSFLKGNMCSMDGCGRAPESLYSESRHYAAKTERLRTSCSSRSPLQAVTGPFALVNVKRSRLRGVFRAEQTSYRAFPNKATLRAFRSSR